MWTIALSLSNAYAFRISFFSFCLWMHILKYAIKWKNMDYLYLILCSQMEIIFPHKCKWIYLLSLNSTRYHDSILQHIIKFPSKMFVVFWSFQQYIAWWATYLNISSENKYILFSKMVRKNRWIHCSTLDHIYCSTLDHRIPMLLYHRHRFIKHKIVCNIWKIKKLHVHIKILPFSGFHIYK